MPKLLTKEELKNRVLNYSRGSGQSLKLLIEVYENQIKDLKSDHEHNLKLMKGLNYKIADLEKENADQLTKAKEIIKQLMYASRDCIAWYCLCDKANKFIKEIENDRK